MVLSDLSPNVLIRTGEVYFNMRLLWQIVKRLKSNDWQSIYKREYTIKRIRSRIVVLYWAAVIDLMSPKLVITFCDNNWKFQALSRLCSKSKFMAIQNGVRSSWNFVVDAPKEQLRFNKKISMPLLLTHGKVDAEMYERYGATIDQLTSVGSLRSSWFYESVLPKRLLEPFENYSLLLISQWEISHMSGDQYPELRKSIELTCDFLNAWLFTRGHSIAIALRTYDPAELDFYKKSMPDIKIHFIEKNYKNMNSYFFAYLSDLVITLDSTLGREVYGWGKKVLFVNFTGSSLYETPVENGCYIDITKYNIFSRVLDTLWEENYEVYRSRTAKNRAWIIEPPFSLSYGYTHRRVKNLILEMLTD